MKKPQHIAWRFFASRLQKAALRLHRDDRGAISILVLLTIWCLVAILAMIWNTTEYAMRRQHMQAAADSAAHASATWMARNVNAIAAQNLVICQDASTEALWRAVPPTVRSINQHLDDEIVAANALRTGTQLDDLRQRMLDQVDQIAKERQLASDALIYLESGTGANFSGPAEAIAYLNQARQARSAMNWVFNTYVNGNPPPPSGAAPPRPGPPGPNGEGLVQLIAKWQPPALQSAILDYIIGFINNTEKPFINTFDARTRPAAAQPIDARMAAHEQQVYRAELAMTDQLSAAIEQQRQQFAGLYRTDLTLATLKNSPGTAGPARVTAPLLPASAIPPVTNHIDMIRVAFLFEAVDAGLSPIVDIDPMHPHTRDAMIWHPNLQVSYGSNTYTINCNMPDGWGHIWTMPMERYLWDRVNRDLEELLVTYLSPLDQSRRITLARAIRQMLGLPVNGNIVITDLPGTIPDDMPDPLVQPPAAPVYARIPVLPALTAPPAATSAYRTQLDLYNRHGAAFTGAVRGLRTTLTDYISFFDRFIQPFAANTWSSQVHGAALLVLRNLGDSRNFMVLSTYQLRPIPDWAKPGMYDSALIAIEDEIVSRNISALTQQILQGLISQDPQHLGGAFLDADYRSTVLHGAYIGQATAIADTIIRPAAHLAALNIAAEWINRPWPYEITPPDKPVPPLRGLTRDDRQIHFSLLSAARQTDDSAPRLLQLQFNRNPIFSSDSAKLVGYAQAEIFNWFEFNPGYGGEPVDQVLRSPWSPGNFVGSPRGWRTATVAGWNWRARLSLADALPSAAQLNPELEQFLQDAGVLYPDSGALDAVNLH